MSEILNWATLDNSDVITFQESGDGTYWVLNGENQIAKPSGRYDKTVNTWEVDGIYEDEKVGPYRVWKTGVYGYPSGIIKELKIYFSNISETLSSTCAVPTDITKLAVGYCEEAVATIKTFAIPTATDLTENTITYTLEEPLPVNGEYISKNKNGLAIIPIFTSETGQMTPSVNIGQIISSITNFTQSNFKQLEVKAYRRSIFDAGSSLINGRYVSDEYTLKMSVLVDIDGTYDHIRDAASGGNFNSYHLDNSTIAGLNSLKFYSPIIINKVTPKNYKFTKLFISHDSLSLNDGITIDNKKIQSLQIPIKTGNAWANGSLSYNDNPMFFIANGTNPADDEWHAADDTLAIQEYNDTEIVWSIKFLKNPLTYTGNGLSIKVSHPSAVRSYTEASSNTDKIIFNNNTYNFTPEIRVVFDFDGRAQFMEMLYRKILA
jgi:hypothetical protein